MCNFSILFLIYFFFSFFQQRNFIFFFSFFFSFFFFHFFLVFLYMIECFWWLFLIFSFFFFFFFFLESCLMFFAFFLLLFLKHSRVLQWLKLLKYDNAKVILVMTNLLTDVIGLEKKNIVFIEKEIECYYEEIKAVFFPPVFFFVSTVKVYSVRDNCWKWSLIWYDFFGKSLIIAFDLLLLLLLLFLRLINIETIYKDISVLSFLLLQFLLIVLLVDKAEYRRTRKKKEEEGKKATGIT